MHTPPAPTAAAPSTASAASTSSSRLLFLDWLRIIALALLVPYHVGMYYVTWGWHIKSPFAAATLEPWLRLSAPWRMTLLFLVSGAATSFMLRRRGATGTLLRQRAHRLLLPLLFGMFVVVPPQSYFEVVQQAGYGGSYVEFMRLYLGGYHGFCGAGGKCLMLPTWNHLWFLPYLFTYTLLLWAALRAWPQALDRLAARAGTWLAGAGLLLWPVLYLVLMRMALQGRFPVTHALVDDPFAHTQYLAAFVLGAVLARSGEVWPRMQRWRWVALGLAAAAWAVLVFADPSPSTLPWRRLAYGVQQWAAIVAAVGFAHRHLNQDGPWRRYLTEAVFPVYILHQTLIVLGATALAPAGLRPAVEGPLLVVGALVAGGLGFETVRRVRWLRPCFGLDRDPPASAGSRASRAISVP